MSGIVGVPKENVISVYILSCSTKILLVMYVLTQRMHALSCYEATQILDKDGVTYARTQI